eukprot:Nitzschia sp. Nitz4//scaffold39_size137210//43905//51277//NITZ4_003195-RA/size137210-augustus-gene-0.188-mRNA-1//-1//CDS//3329550371//2499//frame0
MNRDSPSNHGGSRQDAAMRRARRQEHHAAARGFDPPASRKRNGGPPSPLPTAWKLPDNAPSLRHTHPGSIVMGTLEKTSVTTHRPINVSTFPLPTPSLAQTPSSNNLYPTLVQPNPQVYYFEVTVVCSRQPTPAEVAIGFTVNIPSSGVWPGEQQLSIGWGSDGLIVNGRHFESGVSRRSFNHSDVLGCGVELEGHHRIFFTYNGTIVVPPTSHTAIAPNLTTCYPVCAFRRGSGDILRADFTGDPSFAWNAANDQFTIANQKPKHNSSSASLLETSSSTSSSSNLYASRSGRDSPHDAASMTRSMPPFRNNTYVAPAPSSAADAGISVRPTTSYYGVQNHRNSLVDDDANVSQTSAHFNMNNPSSPPWGSAAPAAPRTLERYQSTPDYPTEPPATASGSSTPRRNLSGTDLSSRREHRRQERAARRGRSRETSGAALPSVVQEVVPPLQEEAMTSHAVGSGSEVRTAKTNSTALLQAAKTSELDVGLVNELLETCKKDQEKLQLRLNNALEEAEEVENLEELFAVNDGICSAIDAANEALKQAPKKQAPEDDEGPAINVLVENEDVFSLICMLRANNERQTIAALALMRFARENEVLRNEIRSSGGMHSFLTMFRMKGMTPELQVVFSMAVAYVLPSFVVSSQTSSTVGLKIVECLRFLVSTHPVTMRDTVITREEMIKAASVGIHVLWINAIQPLLLLESAKAESKQTRPSRQLRASMIGRRASSGGNMFDQGQESLETQELTELAVSLITHIARLTDNPGDMHLDIGYNIVEQVCEVDAARSIAVREGFLKILVGWIRSKQVEKVRPAASALRYLISIQDKYMAGWIHSQVVNENAVGDIVQLLQESIGHDVRLAVAEMVSALCVASHTRAAVVESRCVSFLVALLYEHNDPAASRDMIRFAANALLHLAGGALNRVATRTGAIPFEGTSEKQESVIVEILEGWAHGSFVQIAMERDGSLRSVAVEALRVLSEDPSPIRQTRLQLCGVGAAEALGCVLRNDMTEILPLKEDAMMNSGAFDIEKSLISAVKDVFEALCGLANILEAPKKNPRSHHVSSGVHMLDPREMLSKGCTDVVKSGGMECIIWVSSLPYSETLLSRSGMASIADRMDLVDETCRLLANISPLLLSEEVARKGCAVWACDVFDALHGILARVTDMTDSNIDVAINALRGLGALAYYEPLKTRIVDKSLPTLLALKTLCADFNELSTAVNQVFLSLGFTEDEITTQVAGNSHSVLVDWFCLQRALLLQAMARAELRNRVAALWELPFGDLDSKRSLQLMRQASVQSNMSSQNSDDGSVESEDNLVIQSLFENFTNDSDSLYTRKAMLQQFHDVYLNNGMMRSRRDGSRTVSGMDGSTSRTFEDEDVDDSLLARQVFPLYDSLLEKDWILSHQQHMETEPDNVCPAGVFNETIDKLLDINFPSKLIKYMFVPMNDLRPQASFNFRALMMPQGRYFSFRREGQFLARLCEKQAGLVGTDDVHWSLGFMNSSYAGDFGESIVQSLYLCPMITGLSFVRSADWQGEIPHADPEAEGDEGGDLLASLVGSLPQWVSTLTFDNVLSGRDLRKLVGVLETVGKLSSGIDEDDMSSVSTPSVGQSQGKFANLAIRNSPHVPRESWYALLGLLGKSGPSKRIASPMPLSHLKMLDLSGNKLGDEFAASILELVHDKDSGCNLEQLDLSGNRIGRGINVVRALMAYIEYYRYNQQTGKRKGGSGWKSSLHTLVLAENDLFLGQAALEILAVLQHNTLSLRLLDLSNNGLEGDTYQLLASAILKNTSLCHLNLSGNKFSSPLIDLVLAHVNENDTESSLSFLLLENNTPLLNPLQRIELGRFLRKSRRNALERFLNERQNGTGGGASDAMENAESNDGLELIDETSTNIFRSSFSTHRRRLLPPDVETSLESEESDNTITVLFSAPLVFADEDNKLHPFAKLDFEMERELLWQCMKEASRDIGVSFDTAHHSRLLATVAKRCSCLHYSGHGHAHFLPFEDGMGGPNWLNVQDIKELILRDGNAPFKFVFVSACHSGLAGETFASAGVPHVVCCQQEQELKDTAALAFTRSFYLALAVGHTVKESFEQGCKAVRATPNLKNPEKEMEKFVLLPKNGNHNVPVFNAKPVREWPKQQSRSMVASKSKRSLVRMRSVMALGTRGSELSTRNMMQDDPSPSPPQFFIGREVDMYYLLTALLKMKKRLVNVLGEPGIGRSSLVCALCHYINERASTIAEIQRIFFIKPKHGGRNISCRSLLRQLLDKLEEAGKCRPTEEDTDTEAMLDVVCRALKNERALIVFDRTELLESSDDSQELPLILSTLLYDTKQVKVVLTGKYSLGQPSIGGQVEHPFKLGPINFSNNVRLFANLCPHLHTPNERGLFVSELIAHCHTCAHVFPGDCGMNELCKSIFGTIGGGIPTKIEKAAYSITKKEVEDLRRGICSVA